MAKIKLTLLISPAGPRPFLLDPISLFVAEANAAQALNTESLDRTLDVNEASR